MAKKETQPQIEEKPEIDQFVELQQKFNKDLFNEVFLLTGEIEAEIQWLEQFCRQTFANRGSIWDLQDLIELRNTLEKTRHQLKRQSYCLLYGSDETRYLYGEISIDEYERNLGC